MLKDILPSYPLRNIEVRTYDPFGDDTLFGYCHWTGTELISGDGDNYYLDEVVLKYEFDEDKKHFTYWFESEWIGGVDSNCYTKTKEYERNDEVYDKKNS
jgi:hypothetical protein